MKKILFFFLLLALILGTLFVLKNEPGEIFGQPEYGDLNEDGDDDSLMFLTEKKKNQFYAAVTTDDKTQTVFLGKDISPQTVEIKGGIAVVNYAEQNEGKSKYLYLQEGILKEISPLKEGEIVFWGILRSKEGYFRPCGEGQPEYQLESPSFLSISPVFAVVAGKITKAPENGWGAISISQVIKTSRTGNCKSDMIVLTEPLAEEYITSPLTVKGRARGPWFFEGSFPLTLVDWDGRIISQSIATARGEWMTDKFIEFSGQLEFKPDVTVSNRGTLILQKDNPSGLPEHDDALEVPIFFE